MDKNSSRHLAFDALDNLLKGIDTGAIVTLNDVDDKEKGPEYTHLVNEINGKYNLFTYRQLGNSYKLVLTMEGARVLDLGGIREYLLDFDQSILFYNGFPKVVTVIDEDRDGIVGKWMINTEEEYGDFCDVYGQPPYRWITRTTRRPGFHDSVTWNVPQFPAPANHIHVDGSGNVINAGNVQSGGVAVDNRQETQASPIPDAKSSFWKWTERWQYIVVIVGTIALIILAYLTLKATH
jgi:hypothetical protein